MSRWAKLHAKVSESYDFAEAYARDPNAALLFLLALPQADVYGVLPGHPRLLAGKLCSLMTITEAQVQAAFGVLCDLGLVRAYEDDNRRPLYIIPGYEKHQDVRWDRVGLPEHDLPPDWKPSSALVTACKKYPDCELAAWMQQRCWTNPGVVQEYSRLDTDTDTEVDTDKDTEVDTDKDTRTASDIPSPSPAADGLDPVGNDEDPFAPASDGQPPSATEPKQPRAAEQDSPAQAAIRAVWDACGIPGAPGPTKTNKGGETTKRGPSYATLIERVHKHGAPLFHKFAAYCKREGYAVPEAADPWTWFHNTVTEGMKTAWKWQKEIAPPVPVGLRPGEQFVRINDGSFSLGRDWTEWNEFPGKIAELTKDDNWNAKLGVTKRPTVGMTCEDGWYYASVNCKPVRDRQVFIP